MDVITINGYKLISKIIIVFQVFNLMFIAAKRLDNLCRLAYCIFSDMLHNLVLKLFETL